MKTIDPFHAIFPSINLEVDQTFLLFQYKLQCLPQMTIFWGGGGLEIIYTYTSKIHTLQAYRFNFKLVLHTVSVSYEDIKK